MIKPVRIQRSRQHKQVSPNGLPIICCSRPSKWGNPFITGPETGLTIDQAMRLHENYIKENKLEEKIKTELRGKNLSCWCPLTQRCHVDTLLRIAND